MSLSSFSHNVTSFSSGRAFTLKELLTVTCCEVVKSKENLTYLKDFISKVGYENASEVCFRSNSCTQILPFKTANIISDTCLYCLNTSGQCLCSTDAHLDASQVPFFVKTERSSFYQDNQEIFYKYCHLKLQTSSQILVFTAKNYKSQIKVKQRILVLLTSQNCS
jgi:hypothetical protein